MSSEHARPPAVSIPVCHISSSVVARWISPAAAVTAGAAPSAAQPPTTGDVGVSGAGVPDGDGVGEAVGVADGDAGSASAAPVHPARMPVRRISEASATGTDADFDLVTLTAEC